MKNDRDTNCCNIELIRVKPLYRPPEIWSLIDIRILPEVRYLSTLKRLAALKLDILCQGHRFVFTGEDVQEFLKRSMDSALNFITMVQEFWEDENGDVGRVMTRVKNVEYDHLPIPKQPEQAYLANLDARVKSIIAHSGLVAPSLL